MERIVLLGDSVIGKGAYVQAGDPDVSAQIRARLPGADVVMRAVDGFVSADVAAVLGAEPVPPEAGVVLSAGGNDALQSIGLLGDPAEVTFAAAMVRLRRVRETFRAAHGSLLDRFAGHRVLVATIYDPAFAGDQADQQAPAEGALSAFNDVIQQEALARGHAILDLRRLFDDPADYANPSSRAPKAAPRSPLPLPIGPAASMSPT